MPFQPRVSQKQAAIINDPKKYVLVDGARESSKSYGVLHAIAHKMWNTKDYVGCMVSNTAAQAIDNGLWYILTEKVMPDWVEGRMYEGYGPDMKLLPEEEWQPFGMEWVTKPRPKSITNKMFFEVANKFGGTSKYYLDSLDVEGDVEKRFKTRVFCDILLSESSNFACRETFDCLKLCLRDYPDDQLRFLLDTNPALEDPESHWLFKLFYIFAALDLDNLTDEGKRDLNIDAAPEMLESLKELQASLSVHNFAVSDNDFITPEKKRALFASFAHSRESLDRNFYGKWIRGTGSGIFSEVFIYDVHVLGDKPTPTNDDPEILLPEEDCIELMGSFDIGSRRNTAAYIIEPVTIDIEENGVMTPKTGFKYLDEYVSLGKQQSIPEIAEVMLEKLQFWRDVIGKPVRFEAWSDNSSFDITGQTETSEAQDIWRLTNGEIELRSITAPHVGMKGHGAVERRINLMQRLFFEGRIWISAFKCPHLIQMLQNIKRNNHGKLSPVSIWKHSFDGGSYGPSVRCWMEMRRTSPSLPTRKEDRRVTMTPL